MVISSWRRHEAWLNDNLPEPVLHSSVHPDRYTGYRMDRRMAQEFGVSRLAIHIRLLDLDLKH
jgi:hypothetical protein